jgi:hypothetical protein
LPQKRSDLAHGNIVILSSIALDSKNQYSSEDSAFSSRILSSLHSPKLSEKVLSLKEITSIWWREQSTPPSHMWLRPSGQMTGQTQDWARTVKPVSC